MQAKRSVPVPKLAIVLPCYNEEEILEDCIKKMLEILKGLIQAQEIAQNSYLCFVDDGSSDNSWKILSAHAKHTPNIQAIKLTRNEGHQNALLAGLECVLGNCDCAISTDADLQHDPEHVIPDMVHKYREGYELVLGVSSNRNENNIFKRLTAGLYYRSMHALGVKTVRNHSDTRLMGARSLKALQLYQERKIYLRGLFTNMGFRLTTSEYAYKQRIGGKSKYTIGKMITLALNGISAFSVLPLRIISILGMLISFVSLGFSIWALYIKFFGKVAVPGWASIIVPIFLLGGLHLFALGIIGEYISCIYAEVKQRPRYIIEEKTGTEL